MQHRWIQSVSLLVALLVVNFFTTLWLQGTPMRSAWASVMGQDAPAQTVETAAVADVTIPATFNYQGYVRNADGTLLTDTLAVRARLYKDAVGGNALHDETQANIPVRDGLFNIVLGDVKPFPANLFLDHAPLYLGITLDKNKDQNLDNDPELMPRQRLHAVPWALTASTLTPNATVNGLTNKGPTTLTSAVTMSGSVTMSQTVTVKAIREIGDSKGGVNQRKEYPVSINRYVVEARDNGTTPTSVPISDTLLVALCKDEDGCTLNMAKRNWETFIESNTPGLLLNVGPYRFSMSPIANGKRSWQVAASWSTVAQGGTDGAPDGNTHVINQDGDCFFTDSTYIGGNGNDTQTGFALLNWHDTHKASSMTCVLIIDD